MNKPLTPTPPLTSEEIEKLEELESKATPGPWEFANEYTPPIMILGPNEGDYICNVQIEQSPLGGVVAISMEPEREANAKLILRCRNALPALLSELRSLRAENAALKKNPFIARENMKGESA